MVRNRHVRSKSDDRGLLAMVTEEKSSSGKKKESRPVKRSRCDQMG